jgi:competence protein ComEC
MLRVHFLNVGHGDCTIIKHPSGRLTMIDINNSRSYDPDSFGDYMNEQKAKGIPVQGALAQTFYAMDSAKTELTDPINFLKYNYPGERIWRLVLTHPDLDHMRGIKTLHDEIGIVNFWDTDHTKPTPNFRSDGDKVDWNFYKTLRSSDNGPSHRYYTRGDRKYAFALNEDGSPGGDRIDILSPTADLVRACNVAGKSNSLSLVLRLFHAGRSVLLPGDAEDDAWDIMTGYYGAQLKSDFLKASHHGRDTGYNLQAVKLISPLWTFVSVGRKPDTDASSKYRGQSPRVASTRFHGNIELRIQDSGDFNVYVERNPG